MIIDHKLLVSRGAIYKIFKRGEIIFEEGSKARYYHQLADGKIQLLNNHEDGKEFIQVIVDPGESFGELALFDKQPYAVTAIAVEDCSVIKLSQARFHKIIEEHSDIHLAFTRLFVERLRFKYVTLREFAYNTPDRRVSTMMHHLKKSTPSKKGPFMVNLTRREIASLTGLRTETVIRAIKKLHKKGELTILEGKVYL